MTIVARTDRQTDSTRETGSGAELVYQLGSGHFKPLAILIGRTSRCHPLLMTADPLELFRFDLSLIRSTTPKGGVLFRYSRIKYV